MAFEIVDLACLQLGLCFNNKQVIIFIVKNIIHFLINIY
ncbi:hypothetical protein PESP_a0369 [Pseudoalteromonas espejiana DSM 9414]|nr:hypothetical protein PESP_a0369 [Pseudoalteromonas espejiana DSM 9414]